MSTEAAHSTEQVVLTAKSSNWHYAGSWMLIVFMVIAGIGLFFVDVSGFFGSGALLVRVAPLLCAAGVFCLIQLARKQRVYQVTTKRVIVEWGLLAKSSNELRIQDIRSINVSKRGISGIMGIGNVEFSSAATDDADVIFALIPGADKVRDTVRSLQG